MVRCNFPETGVNTGQSTLIMIMCIVLEPDFVQVLGLYYLSVHPRCRPLIDIRTSKYESNMYV